MWRTFLVVIALSFQIAAYPQRQSTKGHGCWATNGATHEECSFPFEYQGTQYNKCQPYGSSYWCATTSSYTDNPSKWGYCYQCDRQKYWDYKGRNEQTTQNTNAKSQNAAQTTSAPSPNPVCVESNLSGCQTCTSSGAVGKSCLQKWKYNYIWYGGCDRTVVTNGKPWCYTSDKDDWGYCNPDTCAASVSVGTMNAGTSTSTSSGASGKAKPKVSQMPCVGVYVVNGIQRDCDDIRDYIINGIQDASCVGGSLLFEPRPCGRDCATLANQGSAIGRIDAQVNCDTSIGCACPDGKFWADNQSRCVSRQTCREMNVYQIKRPCGLTYDGLYRCQYPFTYQGTEYNVCATYKGRLWCSLDQGDYETHRRWGYCEGLMGRDENKCPPAPAP